MSSLSGRKVLMFVEDNYEDLELWYPKIRLEEEGAEVVIAGPEKSKTYRGKNGYPCRSTAKLDELHSDTFDAVVISGGFAPDRIRRYSKALQLTREITQAGKLVAHICHGGWVPISAGIMKGYKCTSTPAIKDDLTNAGAVWVDQSVVVDRNMVSSRRPDDLPDYMREIIRFLQKQT